jgi:hypothetical protein
MSNKIDFNKYKTEISLPDFLIENYNFLPDEGSSMKYPKLKNTIDGQVLVIKKNANGQYTYFDVHNDAVKGRSILDFVQSRLTCENPNGKAPSLLAVAQVLDAYIKSGKVVAPDNSKYYVDRTMWSKDSILKDLMGLSQITSNDYLKSRGLSESTLNDPLWKGMFFERRYSKDGNVITNTAVKMSNYEGAAGISQRNNSFKGCIGNRFDSLATSIPDNSRPYDKFFIGESMLDCVAHYELHKNEFKNLNVGYYSSEGALTEGQISLLNKVTNEKKPKELVSIFDKDIAGLVYTLKLNCKIDGIDGISATAHDNAQANKIYIDIESQQGINDKLSKLFPKDLFLGVVDEEPSITNFGENKYQIILPRNFEAIQIAIEKMQELRFGKETHVKMELPITKDFNDDLKAKKGLHPDWQIKELNGITRALYKGKLQPLENETKNEKENNNQITM